MTDAKLTVVAGVVTTDHDLILLSQRLPPHPLAGLWNLPGGKVETGEEPWEALRREMQEEVGIEILRHGEPHLGDRVEVTNLTARPFTLVGFDIVQFQGGWPQPREGQPLGWFHLEHLPTVTQANLELLRKMEVL